MLLAFSFLFLGLVEVFTSSLNFFMFGRKGALLVYLLELSSALLILLY